MFSRGKLEKKAALVCDKNKSSGQILQEDIAVHKTKDHYAYVYLKRIYNSGFIIVDLSSIQSIITLVRNIHCQYLLY